MRSMLVTRESSLSISISCFSRPLQEFAHCEIVMIALSIQGFMLHQVEVE